MNGKTILVVDDSATMRDMVSETLRGAGYRILLARDGQDGIGMLAGETVDCIVTDLNMPNLDGLDMIEKLRRDGKHTAIPILVLTTETAPELKARARSVGATGWISKPFEPAKLMDAIRKVGA